MDLQELRLEILEIQISHKILVTFSLLYLLDEDFCFCAAKGS